MKVVDKKIDKTAFQWFIHIERMKNANLRVYVRGEIAEEVD